MTSVVGIRALMILSAVALSVGLDATGQPSGTSLEVAVDQRAPAALRGYVASAGAFLYEAARIENVSRDHITGIAFGVLLVEPNNPAVRRLLRSPMVKVSIPPGVTQEQVRIGLLATSDLEAFELISSQPKVVLGVLAVEWADGRQWRFNLDRDATDFKAGAHRIVKPAGQ